MIHIYSFICIQNTKYVRLKKGKNASPQRHIMSKSTNQFDFIFIFSVTQNALYTKKQYS